MIYDCFIFNDELDMLELRLEKLYHIVDKFVLVETERTHSGNYKPLIFQNNKEKFAKWGDKIFYFNCPADKSKNAWDHEYYQRDYIRECLKMLDCKEDDYVFVSDVDEIIDIKYILEQKMEPPFRIEISFFYFFTNVQVSDKWTLNICTNWKDILTVEIGNRNKYEQLFPNLLTNEHKMNGGHFSYLFGYDTQKYIRKIASISHSEFDNFYFKNPIRIRYCVNNLIDLLERSWIKLTLINQGEGFPFAKEPTANSDMLNYTYYSLNESAFKKFIIKRYLYFLNVAYRIYLKVKK